MKRTIVLIAFLALVCNLSFAQNKEAAMQLVDEGIAYHDKGDYHGAITKYDKALELDKDNLHALAEKALSLLSLQQYETSISYCKRAIELYPGDKALQAVYIAYGNATDGLKKTDESLAIYDEGIKMFPKSNQLYFNKGVTLASIRKYDEALLCMQQAVLLNPEHASSHNAIARISQGTDKTIPAVLAYCRFLAIEPQGNRAKQNLDNLLKLVNQGVEKTGEKSITVRINPDALPDTVGGKQLQPDNFAATEMMLAFQAALDMDKKAKKKTAVKLFVGKLDIVCAALQETKGDNYGFYWDYYVPYFLALKENKLLETFGYIAFASSDEKDVAKWLKSHETEVKRFFDWSDAYKWPAN